MKLRRRRASSRPLGVSSPLDGSEILPLDWYSESLVLLFLPVVGFS